MRHHRRNQLLLSTRRLAGLRLRRPRCHSVNCHHTPCPSRRTSARRVRPKTPKIEQSHSGRTIAEVAKSIGVHEMTLGKWVKSARESGRTPDKDLSESERAELIRLRKEIAIVKMERDFAKKVATWFAKEQP
ncbi:transposase [Pseudonocardia sp. Cha107L01]|uniref:transposase n=1 Tax=Pseudonocardia sp. Cha107L01 TaxID=3457576 RepID=UPI00403EDB39